MKTRPADAMREAMGCDDHFGWGPDSTPTRERPVSGADFAAVEEGGWPDGIIGALPDMPDPAELDAEQRYASLRRVYAAAVEQASAGKGKERHALGEEAFEDQQIIEIGRRLGSNHFELGQAVKKAYESARLPRERAKAELLGAMNYLAAAYLLLEKQVAE